MTETKFAKGVAWLEPFYRDVESLLPKGKRLTAVKGYSKIHGNETTLGCLTHLESRDYILTLQAWTIKDEKRFPYLAHYMLEVFAHELAHLKVWNHTADHLAWTGRFMRRFAKVAERRGIKNLEVRRCKKLGKLY